MFRHGETDWNRDRRLQGHSDIPLNTRGREQAASLATDLRPMAIELILTSDLSRALETARFVARESGAPIIVIPELRETHLGAAEGLTHAEVVAKFGEDSWQRWLSLHPDDDHFSFHGGESKVQLRDRLFRAIESSLHRFPHERVAVSTHGGALRRILHHVHPAFAEPAIIPNCSVLEFSFEVARQTSSPLWSYKSGPAK